MSYTLHTTLLNLCAVEVGQDDVWTFWTVDEEYRTRYYRTRFQDAYDFLEIIGCEERQDYVDESGPAWQKSLTVTAPREADALSLEDEHNVFTGDAWLAVEGTCPPDYTEPFHGLYGFAEDITPREGQIRATVCPARLASYLDVILDLLEWQGDCPELSLQVTAYYPAGNYMDSDYPHAVQEKFLRYKLTPEGLEIQYH